MKKHTLIKLIVLALAIIVSASVLTGCTFSYDEETDMKQVILEINPVTLTYELPVYEDYLDISGNVVVTGYDYSRTSGKISGKLEAERAVRSVRRTTTGEPVRVSKTEGGEPLYLAYSETDGKITESEVKKGGEGIIKDLVSNENFVSPAVAVRNASGDIESYNGGIEYAFEGIAENGANKAARWARVSDGSVFYGDVTSVSGGNADVTGNYKNDANYLSELPVIYYDFSKRTHQWEKLIPVYETAEYVSDKEEFFKVTLNNYFNNYAPSMIQDENRTVDEVFDEFIKNFYISYLSGVEIDLAILSGDVEWELTEVNNINKAIYSGIDTALDGIYREIADDFDQTYPEATDETESDSTYPTPDEEEKEDEYTKDYKFWNISDYPERLIGTDPNPTRVSFEREGMRRLVKVIEDNIADSYALSDTDRSHYQEEIADMNQMLRSTDKTKIDELYANMWTYDVVYYMYGESEAYNLKTEAYRNFLGKSISSESEYEKAFQDLLSEQLSSFANVNNYHTAASGNETILYFADSEYFWVKHILIPFSEAETARLEAYKTGHSDAAVEAYRNQLGENITVYKHVDGEDDRANPYTFAQAYAEINSRMKRAYGDTYSCERTFDQLIYEFNTDPGIFPGQGSPLGYAVTATPQTEGGATETYMIEFANEARAMLNAYKKNQTLYDYKDESNKYVPSSYDKKYMNTEVEIGSISAPVLTDYGWHIMYLSVVPTAGTRLGYNSWLTPGRYTRAYEAVGGSTYDTRLTNTYNSWQESISTKYTEMDNVIVPHKERFRSILDDYAEEYYGAVEEETDESGTTTTT